MIMSALRSVAFAVSAGLCVSPAAASSETDIAAYRALLVQDMRMAITGYRLASANAPFCNVKARSPGWILHSARQYPNRETAAQAFLFFPSYPIAIAGVVPGGPADKAGLKAGDGLADMPGGIFHGGEPTVHKPSSELTDHIAARFRSLWAGTEPVTVTFENPLGRREINLSPPPICASDFMISTGNALDAGADGETVRVSYLLADYAADDAQLAAIVAHELAHNILGHRARLDALNVKRGIGRLFGKSKAAILATEIEADQLSVWLMANAGYDPNGAIVFWTRFGRQHGAGIFGAGTHLRWKNRVAIIQTEIDNIAEQGGPNQSLLPPLLLKLPQ